jgi:hypothetical protein
MPITAGLMLTVRARRLRVYEWMQVADSPEGDVHPELLPKYYA